MTPSESEIGALANALWEEAAPELCQLSLASRCIAWKDATGGGSEEIERIALPTGIGGVADTTLLRRVLPDWALTSPILQAPPSRNELYRFHREGSMKLRWHASARILQLWDPERRRAIVAHHPRGPWQQIARGAPWPWMLQQLAGARVQILHAACVSDGHHTWLIPGVSGTGKSTTSAALYAAGWRILGDDYCLLDLESGRVAPIYRTMKLSDASQQLFPELAAIARSESRTLQDKQVLHLDPARVDGAALRVDGTLLLVRTESPAVQPGTAAEAVKALLPNTLTQLPGDEAKRYASISAWLRGLPTWRLGFPHGSAAAILAAFELLGRTAR